MLFYLCIVIFVNTHNFYGLQSVTLTNVPPSLPDAKTSSLSIRKSECFAAAYMNALARNITAFVTGKETDRRRNL